MAGKVKRRVLALDPSTTCIGYALLAGEAPSGLLDAGLLKPTERRPERNMPDMVWWVLCDRQLRAYRRIYSLLADVRALVNDTKPGEIVVEVPSGKAGTASKRGARASLTTYAAAAGAVLGMLRALEPLHGAIVFPVTERQWAFGGGKDKRKTRCRVLYGKRYNPEQDKGADCADAILLGRWWLGYGATVERLLAEQ